MKKFYLLYVLAFLTSQLPAQDLYTPFVEEGKYWEGQEYNPFLEREYQCDFYIEGDTLIAGQAWKKVYNIMERGNASKTPFYYCAVREESKKVYAVWKGSTESRLLFDFNLQVGDTFGLTDAGLEYMAVTGEGEHTLQLLAIDTVQGAAGRPLRRFTFRIVDEGYEYYHRDGTVCWIEGVGKMDGYPFAWYIDRISSMSYLLNRCRINSASLYPGAGTVVNISLSSTAEAQPPTVFDLQGRRLNTPTRRGLYIRDGRKVVVR